MRRPSLRARAILAALCLPLLALSPAQAADVVATWVGASGNWSDGSNWSTDPDYPNNNGLTYDAVINNGQVALDLDVTINHLTLGLSRLEGDGNLRLLDGGTWGTGYMRGEGTTEVAPGGTFVLLGQEHSWYYLARTLDNHGTIRLAGATITVHYYYADGYLENQAGGLLDLQGDADLVIVTSHGGTPTSEGHVVNEGTVRKSGGGTSDIQWALHNDGVVHVEEGVLELSDLRDGTGTFEVSPGATLKFSGVEGAAGSASGITGGGDVVFGSGAVTVTNGDYRVTGLTTFDGADVALNCPAGGAPCILAGATFNGGTVAINNEAGAAAHDLSGAVFDGGALTITDPTGAAPHDLRGAAFNAGSVHITGPVQLGPALSVQGSSVTLDTDPKTFLTVDLSAGGLGGAFDMTVTGEMTWSGGTMGGAGQTTIAPGKPLRMAGTSGKVLGRTLNNYGWAVLLSSGGITTSSAPPDVPRINNMPGAIFEFRSDANIAGSGAVGEFVFDNAGTFRKSVGSMNFPNGTYVRSCWTFNNSGSVQVHEGRLTFEGPFNNTGTADAHAGTLLKPLGGGTHSGPFYVGPGAVLVFAGGHTLNTGAVVSGAGALLFSGGITDLNDACNVTGSLEFNGGTANFNRPVAPLVKTLFMYSGGPYFHTNAVTFENARIEGGVLGGEANVTVTGELDWEGGAMIGTGTTEIPAGVILDVDEAGTKFLARTINNHGLTTVEDSGNLSARDGGSGAVFNNMADATFELRSEADFTYTGGPDAVFNNDGTFSKVSGTGLTEFGSHWTYNNSGTLLLQDGALTFYGPLNNTGTVDVQPGKTLKLLGGGTCAGTLTAAAGATVEFDGTYTVADTATFTCPGTINVRGGGLDVQTPIQGNNLAIGVWSDARAHFRQLPPLASLGLHGTSVTTFGRGATGPYQTDAFTLAEDAGGVPTATLDLTDNSLLVDYTGQVTPFGDFQRWVASAMNGGTEGKWSGPGITSSAAAAHPQGLATVGVMDNSDALFEPQPELEGVPVAPQTILVKYTWCGDANLDGVVDSNDYDRIDTFWTLWTKAGIMPAGGFRWAVGDFNYDGTLDSNDYDLIDNVWGLSDGASLHGPAPIPTPEPASAALVLAGLALLAGRARSRRRG